MQAAQPLALTHADAARRSLVLLGPLLVALALLLALGEPRAAAAPRWPTDDGLYQVPGWAVGPAAVESAWGTDHVTRTYQRASGPPATFALSTTPVAKSLYKSDADVPFLGSGFSVDAAPPSVVQPAPGRGAVIAYRGGEAWLMLYAFGERRGLLGNGAVGWGMAALDGLLARPNDYYLLRLLVPLAGMDAAPPTEAVALADTLFPRVAAWYSR